MLASNIINSVDIIGEAAHKTIRDYLNSTDSHNIEKIATFLSDVFSIDTAIDQDIIKGYDHDWSNMNGYADALARPSTKLECAIIMNICNNLNIPMTISAGRTNLTGSATPNGGIIISVNQISSSRIHFSSN